MDNRIKKIVILGSTGSIGKHTVKIVLQNSDKVQVIAIAAYGTNVNLILEQCELLRPKYIFVRSQESQKKIKEALSSLKEKIGVYNINELENIFQEYNEQIDVTIGAISGFDGILPLISLIKFSKSIAIANKEAIVCAWKVLDSYSKKYKCNIIPVDSEHNSLFQILSQNQSQSNGKNCKCGINKELITNCDCEATKAVEKLIITASGGPFLNQDNLSLKNITPQIALQHPIWAMGKKNSIDSATMANKGLEIIEASFLFNIPAEKIEAVIHPQSLIHGIVSWKDGSSFAFISKPSMEIHIANAIFKNSVLNTSISSVNFLEVGKMEFIKPDYTQFPSLLIAINALKSGYKNAFIFCVANEVAVNKFLNLEISFINISTVTDRAINFFDGINNNIDYNDFYSLDLFYKEVVLKTIQICNQLSF